MKNSLDPKQKISNWGTYFAQNMQLIYVFRKEK